MSSFLLYCLITSYTSLMPTIQTLISLAISGLVLYVLYLLAATIVSGTFLAITAVILVLVFAAYALKALGVA